MTRGLEVAIRNAYNLPFGPMNNLSMTRKASEDGSYPIKSYDASNQIEVVDFAPEICAVSHLEFSNKSGQVIGGSERSIYLGDPKDLHDAGRLFLCGHQIADQIKERIDDEARVRLLQNGAGVHKYQLFLSQYLYTRTQRKLNKLILDLKEIADDFRDKPCIVDIRMQTYF